jgi:hypothetical protein
MIRRIVFCLASLALVTSVASAQVKLEYKFKEGRKSKAEATTKVHQILTLNNMDIETTSEEVVSETSTSGKRTGDGDIPLTDKVESIKVQLEIAGMMFNFDTGDPNAKFDIPQLAFLGDMLKALAGSEYTVVLDKDNKVKDVTGLDKVLEKAKALNPMAAEALKQRFDVERIRHQFDKSHANLPNVLAREGESWEKSETDDIGSGQSLTFRRRYEYKGVVEKNGKKLDRISIQALDVTYQMDPNAQSPLKVTKSDLKVDSSKGEILFDREEGVIAQRTETNHIKGSMDFEINNQALPGKLDLELTSTHIREPLGDGK